MFKPLFIAIITICMLTSCAQKPTQTHYGKDFVLTKSLSIAEIDQTYAQYMRYKTPVQITGRVKFQCQIRGDWAFIDDQTGLVLASFRESTPNISIPKNQQNQLITIEGTLVPDDSVLNNYRIIPYAFELK